MGVAVHPRRTTDPRRTPAAWPAARSAIVVAPVRTLVISDLHLGTRLGRDVLRRPEPLAALLEALGDVDRLVLLGDIVELFEGRATRAMASAEPVLRALGRRMGPDGEVLVVPGNHDAPLVRRWLRATGGPRAVDALVPPDATPELARIVAWLAPARVTVRYPGVWLADGAWATHGHYLDRHLVPESAFGIARGLLGRLPRDGATPVQYERAGGPSVTRVEALLTRSLPRPLAMALDDLADVARRSTMPRIRRRVLRDRFAPVTARVLSQQMRRASLPALARVVHRLGIDADHVIFGHVHRRGPLPGDDPRRWQGPGGRPRIANTGAWTYEPLLLHRARPPHPYWPGGAILLEDDGDPRALGLLEHLGEAALAPAQTRAGSRPSST
jgi:Calcineurin-like phosphoesterase